MTTLRAHFLYLFSLKQFQVYLPVICLLILFTLLVSFTLQTGTSQVLHYLGITL